MTILISRTDLARNTRKVIDDARRSGPVVVESYGEEQVAVLDIIDYRLLRAAVRFLAGEPSGESFAAPEGLTEGDLEQSIIEAGGDIQAKWDQIVAAHQVNDISLGRAAELLHMNRFELAERYNRLGIPLQLGPSTLEEVWREIEVLRR
ncbi:protein of unknown function [Candidatus Promineifilum breve]|uniref:Antitoxin n=1 Tax=Candidatus Promineifilum breve TaxID=1806508 RepID=A0A160T2K0_9CHLR|nr:hypothetical protein [Candidatus Promineifilum breve]CUS03832.2 protein of unknown function [Candidatus Promineifilum breve]